MNRDGQEKKSGTIRRDPAGTYSRRDDPGVSETTRGAPENGAAGNRERDTAGEEESGARRAETQFAERAYRADAGDGPGSAPEAACGFRGMAISVPK